MKVMKRRRGAATSRCHNRASDVCTCEESAGCYGGVCRCVYVCVCVCVCRVAAFVCDLQRCDSWVGVPLLCCLELVLVSSSPARGVELLTVHTKHETQRGKRVHSIT